MGARGGGGGKAVTGAGTYHSGVTMVAAGFCLEGGVSGGWLVVEAEGGEEAGRGSVDDLLLAVEGGRESRAW